MRISDWSSDVCSSDLEDGSGADLPTSANERSASATPGLSLFAAQAGDRAAQPCLVRRCDVHPDAKGFPVSDGRDGLGEPQGSGLAIVEHHGCRLLRGGAGGSAGALRQARNLQYRPGQPRSEEHTSELQSLMRISYAVFCLKKKKRTQR